MNLKKIAAGSLMVGICATTVPASVFAMESMSSGSMMSSTEMISIPKSALGHIVTSFQNLLSEVKMMTHKTDTKAADLRVLLNALERQHVDLASAAVRAGFDGHASFPKVAAELDTNSIAIADAVGSVYGTAARDSFLKIWRSHIGYFVDYTVAAKAGDKVKMDAAVSNLTNIYVPSIADFFSKANPNLPYDAVAQLVTAHVLHLKAAVDTYGAGDFAGSYKSQTEAYNQIGTIADTLAGGIVKQYPEKF